MLQTIIQTVIKKTGPVFKKGSSLVGLLSGNQRLLDPWTLNQTHRADGDLASRSFVLASSVNIWQRYGRAPDIFFSGNSRPQPGSFITSYTSGKAQNRVPHSKTMPVMLGLHRTPEGLGTDLR